MKNNTTTELQGSAAYFVCTWATEGQSAKSITLDDLAVQELMLQLLDYAQNTTEEIQVFMAWEQKGSKNIIKLAKKNC